MTMFSNEPMMEDPYERCWATGVYDDCCICEFCEHNEDCNGEDED